MTSQCPRCEGPRFTVSVPDELSAYAPSTAINCCQQCLAVDAGEPTDVTAEPPFDAIHTRFPTGKEGVGLLMLLDKLDSLALNRSEIESLVASLESNGVDLFLTLDRLLDEPAVDPYLDLGRRRTQLEQFLDK